jgi:hypothetical protein
MAAATMLAIPLDNIMKTYPELIRERLFCAHPAAGRRGLRPCRMFQGLCQINPRAGEAGRRPEIGEPT